MIELIANVIAWGIILGFITLIVLGVILLTRIFTKQVKKHPRGATHIKKESPIQNDNTITRNTIDYSNAYQAQPLFTRNEWQNYKILKEVTETKSYIICPKVRLLDIVRPRNDKYKYKTLLYKIQSKHVDFVICDQNMTIKAIIELDDNSHDTEKGIERDIFIDTVLQSVGYKVIHTRYITRDILEQL